MSTSTPSTPSKPSADSEHKAGGNVFDWLSSLDSLEKAREEIALKLHLASMDAKSDWEKLEKSVCEVHHFRSANHPSDAEKHGIVSELLAKVRDFGDSLKS